MKQYFNKIHYSSSKSFQDRFIENFLGIFSFVYFLIINTRNYLFKIKFFKTTKLPAYVISIGNLTTGGTGKTPITAEIAKYIKNKYNRNIAVLSRGYGGQLSSKDVNIISDGKNIYSTAHMAGDEPYWMASNLDDIMILTGQSRIDTGNYAINNLDADILILDDGFQHIKLHRDLNILVIDANKRFGNNRLLPAGPLRETISEIKRADKIIFVDKNSFSDTPTADNIAFIENISNTFKKSYAICKFKNGGIYNIKTSEEINSAFKNIYAFAGIAQPEFFFDNLKLYGYNLVYSRFFSDHHLYSIDDLENIINEACTKNANCIITTEKDAVKLLTYLDKININIPIYAQKVAIDIDFDNIITLETLK
jgi:tetraacyldisaccharide 4'-kinase